MVARAASSVWRTWIECVKIRLMNTASSVLAMTERETTQAAADSMPTSTCFALFLCPSRPVASTHPDGGWLSSEASARDATEPRYGEVTIGPLAYVGRVA